MSKIFKLARLKCMCKAKRRGQFNPVVIVVKRNKLGKAAICFTGYCFFQNISTFIFVSVICQKCMDSVILNAVLHLLPLDPYLFDMMPCIQLFVQHLEINDESSLGNAIFMCICMSFELLGNFHKTLLLSLGNLKCNYKITITIPIEL